MSANRTAERLELERFVPTLLAASRFPGDDFVYLKMERAIVILDEEERAEEAGVLRWWFERRLRELSQDVDRAVTANVTDRFARPLALVSVMPSLLSYFSADQPWEDGCLDEILLHWLSQQRLMDAVDEQALQRHASIRQLVIDVTDGRSSEHLAMVSGELLKAWTASE